MKKEVWGCLLLMILYIVFTSFLKIPFMIYWGPFIFLILSVFYLFLYEKNDFYRIVFGVTVMYLLMCHHFAIQLSFYIIGVIGIIGLLPIIGSLIQNKKFNVSKRECMHLGAIGILYCIIYTGYRMYMFQVKGMCSVHHINSLCEPLFMVQFFTAVTLFFVLMSLQMKRKWLFLFLTVILGVSLSFSYAFQMDNQLYLSNSEKIEYVNGNGVEVVNVYDSEGFLNMEIEKDREIYTYRYEVSDYKKNTDEFIINYKKSFDKYSLLKDKQVKVPVKLGLTAMYLNAEYNTRYNKQLPEFPFFDEDFYILQKQVGNRILRIGSCNVNVSHYCYALYEKDGRMIVNDMYLDSFKFPYQQQSIAEGLNFDVTLDGEVIVHEQRDINKYETRVKQKRETVIHYYFDVDGSKQEIMLVSYHNEKKQIENTFKAPTFLVNDQEQFNGYLFNNKTGYFKIGELYFYYNGNTNTVEKSSKEMYENHYYTSEISFQNKVYGFDINHPKVLLNENGEIVNIEES